MILLLTIVSYRQWQATLHVFLLFRWWLEITRLPSWNARQSESPVFLTA